MRKGGLVAFQEIDMDPEIAATSYPSDSLWHETAMTIVISTYSGNEIREPRTTW